MGCASWLAGEWGTPATAEVILSEDLPVGEKNKVIRFTAFLLLLSTKV